MMFVQEVLSEIKPNAVVKRSIEIIERRDLHL